MSSLLELKALGVASNRLQGPLPEFLVACTALRLLDVSSNQITVATCWCRAPPSAPAGCVQQPNHSEYLLVPRPTLCACWTCPVPSQTPQLTRSFGREGGAQA